MDFWEGQQGTQGWRNLGFEEMMNVNTKLLGQKKNRYLKWMESDRIPKIILERNTRGERRILWNTDGVRRITISKTSQNKIQMIIVPEEILFGLKISYCIVETS